jgi:hypothetical protein
LFHRTARIAATIIPDMGCTKAHAMKIAKAGRPKQIMTTHLLHVGEPFGRIRIRELQRTYTFM